MTIQIEAGKYYRTRDGRKVGPMVEENPKWSEWPFDVKNGKGDLARMLWDKDGRADETRNADLIAEWRDGTPAHIITHEGREYDLTKLETPFGLLPEPVQEALDGWPHGTLWYDGKWRDNNQPIGAECFVYRAKPAPVEVRVKCYRHAEGYPIEYGTCIKRADGTIDWTTWEAGE